MTEERKARRKFRQESVLRLTKQLAGSYLGLRLTPGQLKAGARIHFEIRMSEFLNQPLKPTRFFWENDKLNTPTAA